MDSAFNFDGPAHRRDVVGWFSPATALFFLFLYFLFLFFYKNIFLFSKFTEIYPGRPAAGTQLPRCGAAGAFLQKFREIFCRKVPGRSVAGSGAAGPGRPAAGRPAPPPLYKIWLVPPPLICTTKILENKKREGMRERGEALPDFRAGDCR